MLLVNLKKVIRDTYRGVVEALLAGEEAELEVERGDELPARMRVASERARKGNDASEMLTSTGRRGRA